MEETEVKHVLEAALLASRNPLPIDKLVELFSKKAPDVDRALVRSSLAALSSDYEGRGLEIKEVASGFRVQVKSTMADWLQPLWEERAPRYTRALLETLALVAYRQPVTRGEIEEVRGVVVSPNIIRTLLERGWIRVVGHRDVPGKPEMFGTTREFLDYFGLKSLDSLPPLADLKDGFPELSPQTDLIDGLAPDEADSSVRESGSEEITVIDAKLLVSGPRAEHVADVAASSSDAAQQTASNGDSESYDDDDRDAASEPY